MRLFLVTFLFTLMACTKTDSPPPTSPAATTTTPALVTKPIPTPATPSLIDEAACERAVSELQTAQKRHRGFTPIQEFYTNHRRCDDASFATRITSTVIEALNRNWQNIGELREPFGNSSFKAFFLNHIENYVSGETAGVESIIKKARETCPPKQKSLCGEFDRWANEALLYAETEGRGEG